MMVSPEGRDTPDLILKYPMGLRFEIAQSAEAGVPGARFARWGGGRRDIA